ncbi:hypothetical protein H5410_001769, partial [Solanum commersonii]
MAALRNISNLQIEIDSAEIVHLIHKDSCSRGWGTYGSAIVARSKARWTVKAMHQFLASPRLISSPQLIFSSNLPSAFGVLLA